MIEMKTINRLSWEMIGRGHTTLKKPKAISIDWSGIHDNYAKAEVSIGRGRKPRKILSVVLREGETYHAQFSAPINYGFLLIDGIAMHRTNGNLFVHVEYHVKVRGGFNVRYYFEGR